MALWVLMKLLLVLKQRPLEDMERLSSDKEPLWVVKKALHVDCGRIPLDSQRLSRDTKTL